MKKCCCFAILLALLCCAVPAFAAGQDPDAQNGIEYVVSHERIHLELTANDEQALIALKKDLLAMPEVAWVDTDAPCFVLDRDDTNCVYWTVCLRAPYEPNYQTVLTFLAAFPAVLRTSYGCCGVYANGDITYLRSIIAVTDIPDGDETRVLSVQAELAALPGVRDCYNNGIGQGNFGGNMIFFVNIREPVGDHFPAVLAYLQAQPYYKGYIADPVVGDNEPKTYPYGDADLDGQVTAADARSILRVAVGLEYPGTYLQTVLCDIDHSGEITSADARLALRASVALDPVNTFTYVKPSYAGLLVSASAALSQKDGKLLLSASTVGGAGVTECGFESIALQRLENGVWTDVAGQTWQNLSRAGTSMVFSKSVPASHGTYRLVCVHYAKAAADPANTLVARFVSVTTAVTVSG